MALFIQDISWQTFFTIIAGVLATYYILLLMVFYPADIRQFFARIKRFPQKHRKAP